MRDVSFLNHLENNFLNVWYLTDELRQWLFQFFDVFLNQGLLLSALADDGKQVGDEVDDHVHRMRQVGYLEINI